MSRLPELRAEVQLDILFADLDPLNVVYHGNYFRYFEAARAQLLRQINYDYPQMRASGYLWPVIECKCRYMRPILYGMVIRVVATLAEYENRLRITYEIFDQATGARLTRGHTVQVAVDARTNEMCYESPAILRQLLGVSP